MGCAMGTVCAPSYANQFMALFEKRHIYPTSKIWLSYIKNILMTNLSYGKEQKDN